LQVTFEALGEKEDLRMKRPALHVLIKICQIGIVDFRLVKYLPPETFLQHFAEAGFAHSDVAGNGDEV